MEYNNLKEYIKKLVLEELNEVKIEKVDYDKNVNISLYDTNISNDKIYIREHIEEIWNILLDSYANEGGVKGIDNSKHLLKTIKYYTIATYNDVIIAVTCYSTYLGGKKMCYCGTISGRLHKNGVKALNTILKRDEDDIEEYYWMEVSGGVEAICNRLNIFNIPNKYTKEILKRDVVLEDDGYHYERVIGKEGNSFRKTIYGFPNKEIFGKVYNEAFSHLWELITSVKNRLEEQIIIDEGMTRYPLSYCCQVTDLFDASFYGFDIDCYTNRLYYLMETILDNLYYYLGEPKYKDKKNLIDKNIRTLLDIMHNSTIIEYGKVKLPKLNRSVK